MVVSIPPEMTFLMTTPFLSLILNAYSSLPLLLLRTTSQLLFSSQYYFFSFLTSHFYSYWFWTGSWCRSCAFFFLIVCILHRSPYWFLLSLWFLTTFRILAWFIVQLLFLVQHLNPPWYLLFPPWLLIMFTQWKPGPKFKLCNNPHYSLFLHHLSLLMLYLPHNLSPPINLFIVLTEELLLKSSIMLSKSTIHSLLLSFHMVGYPLDVNGFSRSRKMLVDQLPATRPC